MRMGNALLLVEDDETHGKLARSFARPGSWRSDGVEGARSSAVVDLGGSGAVEGLVGSEVRVVANRITITPFST